MEPGLLPSSGQFIFCSSDDAPHPTNGRNLPVVVFPHGGQAKHNYWGYDPRVQFLASRGYAVF